MTQRKPPLRGTIAGATLLLSTAALGADNPSVFEEPSKVTTVVLPSDSLNPTLKRERSCFYYPGIMVKQVNYRDEKGAHRLSFVPAPPGGKPAPCKADNVGEVIIPWQKWSGYYHGKRGAVFIFDAANGFNGMPFAVFSSAGSRMLTESRDRNILPGHLSEERDTFRSVRMDGTALVVRYRRAWLAPCSLYSDPAGCWPVIMAKTGLPDSAQPDCHTSYEADFQHSPKIAPADLNHKAQMARVRSVIGYEVEARVSQGKTAFTALPGRATCFMET